MVVWWSGFLDNFIAPFSSSADISKPLWMFGLELEVRKQFAAPLAAQNLSKTYPELFSRLATYLNQFMLRYDFSQWFFPVSFPSEFSRWVFPVSFPSDFSRVLSNENSSGSSIGVAFMSYSVSAIMRSWSTELVHASRLSLASNVATDHCVFITVSKKSQ